ncbi:YopX family protein [Paenibacillus elgii]|uniref:YopX family protein n=1 Tax=Paenibacillus elgii TaxID=189691 RepID=UPI0013D168F4|nr:YopX family protein [Paenibacillus elgii]
MANTNGMEQKFVVFNVEDISAIGKNAVQPLLKVQEEVANYRSAQGKNENTYLVINVDEPYADEVIEIMKRHGHWGGGMERMREYKFRGRRIDTGEWVYFNLYGAYVDKYGNEEIPKRFTRDCGYGVDPETIGQYTGLRDSKRTEEFPDGQEIYEGDVFPPPAAGRNENRIVVYDSEQAKYKAVPVSLYHANTGNGGWTGYELRWTDEVIGNIWEHPHLLEEAKSQ